MMLFMTPASMTRSGRAAARPRLLRRIAASFHQTVDPSESWRCSASAVSPRPRRAWLEDLSNTASHVVLAGRATDALRESERKLQAILRGCPVPQMVIDRHHNVISWNRPLEKYSQLSEEQMIGTSDHWRAFYPVSRPCLVDLLVNDEMHQISRLYGDKCRPAPLLEGAYEGTDFFATLGPKGTWLHFTAAPIRDAQGGIIGAIETFEDISERRSAEMELQARREMTLKCASCGALTP